ncbi:MAG: membrane protein insertion efficiency factor YidD [Planctomycetes bacterium]|nr:membrane protein insertion efficiency factor YidD [Planctomycetota bacterium]
MDLHVHPERKGFFSRLWSWRLLPFLALLWLYKRGISPVLPPSCRYQPTCSEYAFQAIKTRGVLAGCVMALLRLLRCAPWGGYGYDPVEAFHWPWEKHAK